MAVKKKTVRSTPATSGKKKEVPEWLHTLPLVRRTRSEVVADRAPRTGVTAKFHTRDIAYMNPQGTGGKEPVDLKKAHKQIRAAGGGKIAGAGMKAVTPKLVAHGRQKIAFLPRPGAPAPAAAAAAASTTPKSRHATIALKREGQLGNRYQTVYAQKRIPKKLHLYAQSSTSGRHVKIGPMAAAGVGPGWADTPNYKSEYTNPDATSVMKKRSLPMQHSLQRGKKGGTFYMSNGRKIYSKKTHEKKSEPN